MTTIAWLAQSLLKFRTKVSKMKALPLVRFSTFPSIISWTLLDDVCKKKIRIIAEVFTIGTRADLRREVDGEEVVLRRIKFLQDALCNTGFSCSNRSDQ